MAATGIDRSSTADLVRQLVSNRWLQRRRTRRDALLYAVRLSPKGRGTWSLGEPAARATDEALLSRIPPINDPLFWKCLR